jgi:hypothetical protein
VKKVEVTFMALDATKQFHLLVHVIIIIIIIIIYQVPCHIPFQTS